DDLVEQDQERDAQRDLLPPGRAGHPVGEKLQVPHLLRPERLYESDSQRDSKCENDAQAQDPTRRHKKTHLAEQQREQDARDTKPGKHITAEMSCRDPLRHRAEDDVRYAADDLYPDSLRTSRAWRRA